MRKRNRIGLEADIRDLQKVLSNLEKTHNFIIDKIISMIRQMNRNQDKLNEDQAKILKVIDLNPKRIDSLKNKSNLKKEEFKGVDIYT